MQIKARIRIIAAGMAGILVSLGGTAVEAAPRTSSVGSYLGGGLSFQGLATSPSAFGGNVTGRLKLEGAPLSLRSSVLFGRDGTAIVPTISWDIPASDRLNLFVGAGGTFPLDQNATLVGNRSALAVQPGVELSLNDRWVLYGNAIVPLSGATNGSAGVALQSGIGFQF
ncbi:MAG: porin family protein [Pseudanabaenaceae cyanobacterium]